MEYIPRWAVYLAIGVTVVAIIYFAAEYLDAATSMLPSGEGGGKR
jgi:hypothetical protein